MDYIIVAQETRAGVRVLDACSCCSVGWAMRQPRSIMKGFLSQRMALIVLGIGATAYVYPFGQAKLLNYNGLGPNGTAGSAYPFVGEPQTVGASGICGSSDLRTEVPPPPDGGSGHFALVLQVTNISQRPCGLRTDVNAEVVNSRGTKIPMRICLNCPDSLVGSDSAGSMDAATVQLEPRRSAYSVMSYHVIEGPGHDCHVVHGVVIDLGGSSGSITFKYKRFHLGIEVCDEIGLRTWQQGKYIRGSIP
jgi:hypothetical protein